MSKGSSYWSTARGKIGNTVVSIVKGQRIEKAYQPVVNNPRTDAQMKQRARFANVVKFYKAATSQFFKFAFEDKKQTESEFNAFMRWNTNQKASILKYEQVKGNYPALGNNYVMTAGSLGETSYEVGNQAILYLPLPSLVADAKTIGELSAALINDYNLVSGDIVTIVRVASSVSSLTQANPTILPKWSIKQFSVNPSSTELVASVDANLNVVTGQGLYLDSEQRNSAYWYAVIFSRQTSTGLKVSTSLLSGNSVAVSLYNQANASDWVAEAITTWGATGEAILQGKLVKASVSGVIETVAGNPIPHISDTTLSAGVKSSAKVTGLNLKAVNVSEFSGKGLTIESFNATSDTEATIVVVGKGDYPNAWVLYYGSQVIAQHSLVSATIESVNPSSSDVLGAGDSVTLTIKGDGVDALTASDFVVSDANLSIAMQASTNVNEIKMVVTASAEVSSATISYKDKVIYSIEEIAVEITSEVQRVNASGSVTIEGSGLASLTAESFTNSTIAGYGTKINVTNYEPAKDGNSAKITFVIVESNLDDGILSYKDQQIIYYSSSGVI